MQQFVQRRGLGLGEVFEAYSKALSASVPPIAGPAHLAVDLEGVPGGRSREHDGDAAPGQGRRASLDEGPAEPEVRRPPSVLEGGARTEAQPQGERFAPPSPKVGLATHGGHVSKTSAASRGIPECCRQPISGCYAPPEVRLPTSHRRDPSHRSPCCTALLVAIAALAAAGSPAATVAAQERADIEGFRPTPDAAGYLGIPGTRTPGSGRWSFGYWLNYSNRPLVAELIEGGETAIVDHRLSSNFLLQVGLGGRVSLGLDLPVLLHQTVGDVLLDGGPDVQHNGLGDLRLTGRVRVYGNATSNAASTDGPALALVLGLRLPTGTEEAFAGEGVAGLDLAVVGDFQLLGLGVALVAGWHQRFEDRVVGGVEFREELELGLGLNVPIPVTHDLLFRAELRTRTDGRAPFGDSARTLVETDFGFSLARKDVTVWVAAGVGLTGGVGAPRARGLLGISWAPVLPDADGDGVPDDRDECVHLPEDMDGFEDEDGCEDFDDDEDFVPDLDDQCPTEAALEGRDRDEDGCTDALVDPDGDGIDEAFDACPDAAGPGDGCPEEAEPEPVLEAVPEAGGSVEEGVAE